LVYSFRFNDIYSLSDKSNKSKKKKEKNRTGKQKGYIPKKLNSLIIFTIIYYENKLSISEILCL